MSIEKYRQPDDHIGYIFSNFSMGSILSSIMIFLGLIFLTKLILNEKNR